MAILELRNGGGTTGQGKSRGQHKCLSCMVIFHCFEDEVAMINPLQPNVGLWILLNINYRYYSPETPKRQGTCNHTRALLCRIFCANHATSHSTAHVKRNTIFRTQICRPHMNENSSTKVNTNHMKAKFFQSRIPSWHRDKKAVDRQVVSSKYSYWKAHLQYGLGEDYSMQF